MAKPIQHRQRELDAIVAKCFGAPPGPNTPMNKSNNAATRTDLPAWLLARLRAAQLSNERFAALYGGEWQGRYPSQSEADLAMTSQLLKITDGDKNQADMLFRRSGLFRDKWDREYYRARTLERAGNGLGKYDGYTGRGESHSSQTSWPAPLGQEAYQGVVGELVRLIEPHSEADPAALLVQALIAVGSVIGRQVHFVAEADRHYTKLFTVIVGLTSKGRKGTSLGHIQRILAMVDPAWSETRIMGGLASGEGLIWAVRDEIRGRKPVRDKGRVVSHKDTVIGVGVHDKRLLVVEPEFARVLQVAERETNTLSAVIRQAWDSGSLRIMTKNQAASATGAHISIIGHITKDELKRSLTSTAAANGFANRFLWICARRSKVLPEGGALGTVNFEPITKKLRDAIDFAGRTGEIRRGAKARALWRQIYEDLSEGKPGLLGSVTSRAEAQTMRLASVYAFLDSSPLIRVEHLRAALEVWRYSEGSARFIFGDALGDSTADEILRALRARQQEGMTRDDIREHFSRNRSSAEIERALSILQEHGLARMSKEYDEGTPGRPTERWFSTSVVRERRG